MICKEIINVILCLTHWWFFIERHKLLCPIFKHVMLFLFKISCLLNKNQIPSCKFECYSLINLKLKSNGKILFYNFLVAKNFYPLSEDINNSNLILVVLLIGYFNFHLMNRRLKFGLSPRNFLLFIFPLDNTKFLKRMK